MTQGVDDVGAMTMTQWMTSTTYCEHVFMALHISFANVKIPTGSFWCVRRNPQNYYYDTTAQVVCMYIAVMYKSVREHYVSQVLGRHKLYYIHRKWTYRQQQSLINSMSIFIYRSKYLHSHPEHPAC